MERFIEKVSINKDGCWIWQAFKEPKFGYGRFKLNGKNEAAHRASWVIHNGPIPSGLLVCHKCDIPSCVNPDHLFLGTHKDNSRDRDIKGRGGPKFGFLESNIGFKVTDDMIEKINKDQRSKTVIAREYGVSRSTVLRIKTGQQRKLVLRSF